MIVAIFEWIVVGGAHRIVAAAPELVDQGGVTPDEAFVLLATERGRRARYCAQEIMRTWELGAASVAIGVTGPVGPTGLTGRTGATPSGCTCGEDDDHGPSLPHKTWCAKESA
jgi:hypothetical protein